MTKDSIRLDPQFGVNPHLVETQCPCCGGIRSDEIALLGNKRNINHCKKCERDIYGSHAGEKCPACGALDTIFLREIEEHERIPAGLLLCDTCKDYQKRGIVFLSVRDGEQNKKSPYRTGGFWVLKEEAVKRMLSSSPGLLKSILEKRVTFVEDSVCEKLGLSKNPKEDTPCPTQPM